MIFQSPAWLGLVLLALLVGLFERHRHRLVRTSPALLGVVARTSVLVLLGLALAQPLWRASSSAETVVFVLDRSASIPEAERQRAWAEAEALQGTLDVSPGIVAFDHAVAVLARPGEPTTGPLPSVDRGGVGDGALGTALGSAIEAALALCPEDAAARIHLWSDGRDTQASLAQAVARLATRPVALEIHLLDPAIPEPAIASLAVLPDEVSPGASITVTLQLHGGRAGHEGPLTFRLGDRVLHEAPLSLDADVTTEVTVTFSIPDDAAPGPARLDVALGGSSVATGLSIVAPPTVWLVAADPRETEGLARILEAEKLLVTRLSPQGLTLPDPEVKVIVLANVPTGEGGLPAPFVAALPAWVEKGGALVAVGGDHAYDLGGWKESPLAALLPIEIETQGPERDAPVTLVLAVDKSGSMAQDALGVGTDVSAAALRGLVEGRPSGSKIRLVAEAVVSSLARLRPQDRAGVLAVDTAARWRVPIATLDFGRMADEVRAMGAGGGGINMVTALDAAVKAMVQEPSPLRHLILFADTADASEQKTLGRGGPSAQDVVVRMAEQDITMSIIGIGGDSDADTAFLDELARAAGGRFVLASDFDNLTTLFVEETDRLLRKSLEEEPIQAVFARRHAILRGVDGARAPPLDGHNAVRTRPRTQVLIATPDDVPLLAVWQVGVGQVAAWTTDAGGRWAGRWTRWDGYARIWTQLVRHLSASGGVGAFPIELSPRPGGLLARIVVRDEAGESALTPGVVLEAEGANEPLLLELETPGVWTASLDAPAGRSVVVRARDAEGRVVGERAGVVPPSEEHRYRTVDDEAFAQLREAAHEESGPRGVRTMALWPWLAGLALALLPLDAHLRRPLRRRGRAR